MDYLDYFRTLVAIPSPSKDEGLISSYIKSEMSSLGYQYKEDSVGNLLFYRKKECPKLMFACHMDTVPPAVNAHLVETKTRFKTDGTTALGADDKAALAVLLDIARKAKDDFALLAVVAEEIGLYGSSCITKEFFEGMNIIGCYTLDTTNSVGGIITGAIGKSRLTLTVHGKSAHAGFAPEKGVNAIKIGSEICSQIQNGRIDKNTTLNIGSFIAEGSTNVVPDKARITLEVRSNSDQKRISIIENIKRNAIEIASKHSGSVDILDENLYSPYTIDTESSLYTKMSDAIKAIGRDVYTFDTTGGSDANNLNKLGIETILITNGYFNAHSVDEYIEKSELKALYDLVSMLIKK